MSSFNSIFFGRDMLYANIRNVFQFVLGCCVYVIVSVRVCVLHSMLWPCCDVKCHVSQWFIGWWSYGYNSSAGPCIIVSLSLLSSSIILFVYTLSCH